MDELREVLKDVGRISGLKIKEAVPAAPLTTFRIGGPIEFLVEVHSEEALAGVLACLARAGVKARMLGAGSNLLVSSTGVKGVVLRLGGALRGVRELGSGHFEIGAAARLVKVSRELGAKGWQGLEFAVGIPGSFGGAVFMNAGAHGAQIMDVVRSITYIDAAGRKRQVSAAKLPWTYRSGGLPHGCVASKVQIELKADDVRSIESKRRELLHQRKLTQPLAWPSAGSVFKNPGGEHSAGYLIEQCGLKGACCGGAVISDKHANWIINRDRTAVHSDVLALMRLCREQVWQQHGVALELEIQLWCEAPW